MSFMAFIPLSVITLYLYLFSCPLYIFFSSFLFLNITVYLYNQCDSKHEFWIVSKPNIIV